MTSTPRDRVDLFLISILVLFLELACIRWFPSHVLFLTFFTNTVLLAAVLGMSVGCLVASRKAKISPRNAKSARPRRAVFSARKAAMRSAEDSAMAAHCATRHNQRHVFVFV